MHVGSSERACSIGLIILGLALPVQAQDFERCALREMQRSPLSHAPGYQIYIEPTVLVRSGDELLLAGAPSYLFRREHDGTTSLVARDSVFGAIIDTRRGVRLVPFPFRSVPVSDVRAVARAAGGWEITFAELPRDPFPSDGPIVRLWYGVFDGRQWTSTTQLPTPRELHLRPWAASSLVTAGDSLLWALPGRTTNGGDAISLYTHTHRAWAQETIPVPGLAYVELGRSDSLGVFLLAVHPDSTLLRDGNSLFLYARESRWTRHVKLAPGAQAPVHFPFWKGSTAHSALTWLAVVPGGDRSRYEARAMIATSRLGDEPAIALDSSVANGRELVRLDSRWLWMFEHLDENSRELRIIADSAGSAVRLGALPYPYEGAFRAAVTGASELILAGPLRGEPPRDAGISTMLWRLRLECGRQVR
ncbi:MAG TPA: hypothetical protein VJ596_11995 [Gemmatimonadaceae bacterium]|nr:hypothetical protein [Gemmatimonadaceae bacterium]